MQAKHLEAVGAAVKVDVHDRGRVGAALRRQRLLPVRQLAVAELAVRLPPIHCFIAGKRQRQLFEL